MPRESDLQKLSGLKQLSPTKWRACCPAHDDQSPSLDVDLKDGKLLFICRAGCPQADVLRAWGIEERKSGLTSYKKPSKDVHYKIVEEYSYLDENRALLYVTERLEGVIDGQREKKFRAKRPDGQGGWIKDIKGIRRVVFNLPDLADHIKGQPVFIVEGEKDCNTLKTNGLLGITSAFGANGLTDDFLDGFVLPLVDHHVVILPDNDEAGRGYAKKWARALYGKAASIKYLELPRLSHKQDITDWLNEHGGSVGELFSLVEQTPEWTPTNLDHEAKKSTVSTTEKSYFWSWASTAAPSMKWIIDGILPSESCCLIGGKWKVKKTWLTFDAAVCVAMGVSFLGKYEVLQSGPVIIYSPESGLSAKQERLVGLSRGHGLDPYLVEKNVHIIRERHDLSLDDELAALRTNIESIKPRLLVIDPLICSHANLDENSSTDMQRLLNRFRGLLECSSGMSLIIVHHENKASDGGVRSLRGSSAIDGWYDELISLKKINERVTRGKFLFRDAGDREPIAYSLEVTDDKDDRWPSVPIYQLIAEDIPDEPEEPTRDLKADNRYWQILGAVKENSGVFKRVDLANRLGIPPNSCNRVIETLVRDQKVSIGMNGRLYVNDQQ